MDRGQIPDWAATSVLQEQFFRWFGDAFVHSLPHKMTVSHIKNIQHSFFGGFVVISAELFK
jgi:hypothetical protein